MSQYLYGTLKFIFVDHIRELLTILLICNAVILISNLRLLKKIAKIRNYWQNYSDKYNTLFHAVAYYAALKEAADKIDGLRLGSGHKLAREAYKMALKVDKL